MTPGEMYWVEFPPSDGHEQAGRRPAIVVQDLKYSPHTGTVLVVPVTGQPKNSRFAGTVMVQPTHANGLLKESVILVFQIRAVDRRRILRRIGVVEAETMERIFKELDSLCGRAFQPPTAPVE